MAWQERLDDFPKFIGYKRTGHGAPPMSDSCLLLFYGALFLLESLIFIIALP